MIDQPPHDWQSFQAAEIFPWAKIWQGTKVRYKRSTDLRMSTFCQRFHNAILNVLEHSRQRIILLLVHPLGKFDSPVWVKCKWEKVKVIVGVRLQWILTNHAFLFLLAAI